ncbi:hypothetical protein PENPOL_c002G09204 [Penicillium polonicum]|uniref:Uncharacterized protein n=1 Tax=Penicillium polonicum TaxID=60169 RepID=A0A1V6NWC5_PENPO|nr:hypothetical protein PENPOL_c002G09204 [Penicillium polonicum]
MFGPFFSWWEEHLPRDNALSLVPSNIYIPTIDFLSFFLLLPSQTSGISKFESIGNHSIPFDSLSHETPHPHFQKVRYNPQPHRALPPLEDETDKEAVADQRPIPTPDNDQMELLTQLRFRATARAPAIRRAVRQTTLAMAQLDAMVERMDWRDEPNPGVVVMRQLEHILARLLYRLMAIREGEAHDMETEGDLWRQITH